MATESILEEQTVSLHDLQTTLLRTENKFRRACNQIVIMNVKLRTCIVRYNRAKSNDKKSFRYPLRMRLAIVEGVRDMYYEFAAQKANEVDFLRRLISDFTQHAVIFHS